MHTQLETILPQEPLQPTCEDHTLICSIVIPCYNESKNLPVLVNHCKKMIARAAIEFILVDNGSTDDTPAVLPYLVNGSERISCIRIQENQGYGAGILRGLQQAKGQLVGWTHADLQTDPEDILQAVECYRNHGGKNIFIKGTRRGRKFSDTVFTVAMSLFESLLLGQKLWDINAQPTVFSKALYESWHSPPLDFSLDLFAYYYAKCCQFPVKRIPVLFPDRVHGHSHWNINWKQKLKFIKRTMVYSYNLKRSFGKTCA